MDDECLMLHLKLSDRDFGTREEQASIRAFLGQLEECVTAKNVGELDGDEFGGGECTLYFYGPDADRLFETVLGLLNTSPLSQGGYAIRQYDLTRELPDQRTAFPSR